MEKTTDEKASERLAALQHDIACGFVENSLDDRERGAWSTTCPGA